VWALDWLVICTVGSGLAGYLYSELWIGWLFVQWAHGQVVYSLLELAGPGSGRLITISQAPDVKASE
jgi:hypothetical protein